MPLGVKKTFITPLTVVADSDLEVVGTVRREGDDEYLWCLGIASCAIGSVVTISEAYALALVTTALGAVPRRIGVAMSANVAAKFGWVQIRGVGSILGVALAAANVDLFTDTSNAGHVDDTAASEHSIADLVITTTVGGSNALAPCLMNHPWSRPLTD
jgi:hypothetical protein